MMMEGGGVLRTAAVGAKTTQPLGALSAWDFQWVPQGAPEQWAHVTGQLRWRGFDIGFAADGLLGVDGRLAAQGVATMPSHLQQLVLQHFADECLQPLKDSPLADMTLLSLQWHEDPLPMEGEFEFTLKRTELSSASRGRLTVFDAAGRLQLINALASLQWPMPQALSTVSGHLQIGSTHLSAEECAGLEVGDLVWLDDAELAPTGLRAQFIPKDESEATCFAWIKRSTLTWQCSPAKAAPVKNSAGEPWSNPVRPEPVEGPCQSNQGLRQAQSERLEVLQGFPGFEAGVLLKATSPEMTVQRSGLQGSMTQQPLAQTALALPWQLCDAQQARFEGQLLVVGRRLGLRITRVL